MIDLNLDPSKRELRTFGFAALGFSAILAGVILRRTGSVLEATSILAVGGVLALLGLVRPAALRPVFVAMMVVSYPIGWVMTHVLMGVIYYLVVTPVAVIMRLSGRDPLERRFDRGATTYWKPRRTNGDASRYFRQF